MLRQALNCTNRWHGSGTIGRIVGEAIGADAYLPGMATEEFLRFQSHPD
jgi:hypothetical protein